MVGATGLGEAPRTAPTHPAQYRPVDDRMVRTSVRFMDPIRHVRMYDFTTVLVEPVNQFLSFVDGARVADPSVGTAKAVSSAPSIEAFEVDQPALPSDQTGTTGGAAPGVNTATTCSASHGGRAVAAVTAHLSGHIIAAGAQHDRADVPSGDWTIPRPRPDQPALHQ